MKDIFHAQEFSWKLGNLKRITELLVAGVKRREVTPKAVTSLRLLVTTYI
jgi:hypothetical protein